MSSLSTNPTTLPSSTITTVSPPPQTRDPSNLCITHLPKSVDAKYLRELFDPFGLIVSSHLLLDVASGLSRGIGFIRYEQESAAKAAQEQMDKTRIHGIVIQVRFADSKHNTTMETRGKIVYFRNIPGDAKEEEIRAMFEKFGEVTQITHHPQSTILGGGSPYNMTFVSFATEDTAAAAVEQVDGKMIFPRADASHPRILAKIVTDITKEKRKSIIRQTKIQKSTTGGLPSARSETGKQVQKSATSNFPMKPSSSSNFASIPYSGGGVQSQIVPPPPPPPPPPPHNYTHSAPQGLQQQVVIAPPSSSPAAFPGANVGITYSPLPAPPQVSHIQHNPPSLIPSIAPQVQHQQQPLQQQVAQQQQNYTIHQYPQGGGQALVQQQAPVLLQQQPPAHQVMVPVQPTAKSVFACRPDGTLVSAIQHNSQSEIQHQQQQQQQHFTVTPTPGVLHTFLK